MYELFLKYNYLAIACIFDVNVDVSIYNYPLYPPSWQRTAPVPELTEHVIGSYNDVRVIDMFTG